MEKVMVKPEGVWCTHVVHTNYSVRESDGAIWSARSKKLLRPSVGKGNYYTLGVYGKQVRIDSTGRPSIRSFSTKTFRSFTSMETVRIVHGQS
jgi:hypothetical protein